MRPPTFLGLALAALTIAAVPAPALAQQSPSIGVTPATLAVENAIPGQTYIRELVVQNNNDVPMEISVERFGEVGDWSAVTPAERFQLPPRGNGTITMSIAVPADVGDGERSGTLQIVAAPQGAQTGGSGFVLRSGVLLRVVVNAGGEPLERVTALRYTATDVDAGETPTGIVEARNVGNVQTEARVSARVLQDGRILQEASGSRTLRPGERGDVVVRFPTALPVGTYHMELTLANADDQTPRMLPFLVAPAGDIGRAGVFRYLAHEPWVEPTSIVVVTAVFENTGANAISRARFVGQVEHNGRVVAPLESEALTVPVGREVELVSRFATTSVGEYVIRGKVIYDGLESEEKWSKVNAATGATATESRETDDRRFLVATVVTAGAILVTLGIMWHMWRRR